MVVLTAQSGKTMTYVNSYQVDTEDEVAKIDLKEAAPGSDCFVLETGNVYKLNSKKDWILL